MNRFLSAVLLLFVFSAFLSIGAQDIEKPDEKPDEKVEKFDLKPQFQKDMVFEKTTEFSVKVAMMAIEFKQQLIIKVTVLETEENQIRKAKIEFKKMGFAGAEGMGEQLRQAMKQFGMDDSALNLDLTGHWIVASFKKDGTISKIESKSEKFPEKDSKQYLENFKIFDEEVPEEKVPLGFGWTLSEKGLSSMGRLTASAKFEKIEEKEENKIAILNLTFKLDDSMDQNNPMAQMMMFEGKGVTKVDITKHRILGSDFTLKYSIEMMGLEIPIEYKNTYNYDVKEEEKPETPEEHDTGDDF